MKRLFIIYLAALAALVSCSMEINDVKEERAVKLIPYRAEVTGAGTKATLDGSTKYIFEAGDRLYVSHTSGSDVKMHGFLTMISGAGDTKAVFQGDLVCDDDFTPENSTPVDIVLVGADDLLHTASSGGLLSAAAAYPDDVYASSLADAVRHYSNFTCSAQFGDGSFVLSQQSSFLQFYIKIRKALAPVGSTFTARIYNNNGADLMRSATVSTVDNTPTTTKVEFVAVFPGGSTTLTDASISLVGLHQWAIGDATLARNNYYNINRAFKTYDGFRIIAREAGTITRSTAGSASFEYSTDYGETWQSYSSGIPVTAGDEVCFRSTNKNWINNTLASSAPFDVAGDITSLIKGSSFPDGSIPSGYSFNSFFKYCETLIDASELVLSMTNAGSSVYRSTFDSCTNLVAGPSELPSTNITDYCYRNMFLNCSSLVSAPIIPKPASRGGANWYQQMFMGCSSLQEIVFLDDYNYVSGNFTDWVNGVSSSGTFYKSSTMSFPSPGNSSTPTGWTVVD
ncbi:MAG: hypothetical protein J6W09_01805, partial [Bacteroidales bacterium]|nr:hypothetical protein [Bacteroidales bacterium]